MIEGMPSDVTENIPCLEYEEETDEYTITFENVDDMMDAYRMSPIVKIFIEYEILVRRAFVHEIRSSRHISGYEVTGFVYRNLDESYTIDLDWLEEVHGWIKSEFEAE